jgi:ADP-dependent NAD(P)H-hydrate dehydratase / NAD(P)H-hydrate epimerase
MARIDIFETACCYSVADIRALESYAIEKQDIPAIRLMNRAGQAAFEAIAESITESIAESKAEPTQLHVFCGGGNNGGDGFVVAGLAADAGWPVNLIDLSNPDKLSEEAIQARNFALQRLDSVSTEIPDLTNSSGVIVDALLGIGFSGELRGVILQACCAINQSWMPVFSLDTPSGVNADTGACAPDAVVALTTISFIAAKRGMLTGAAENCVGELIVDDLGLSDLDNSSADFPELKPHPIITEDSLEAVFPPRFANAHKGAYGHLLIVGGNLGMSGAVSLAAEAALTLGVGKISVATRQSSLAPLLSRVPEVMARQVDHYNDLKHLIDQCTAIVIGPGLGTDAWAEQMLLRVLSEDIPVVVDADAIRLIAAAIVKPTQDRICFTPHPGEAALVLNCSTAEIQEDRFKALSQLENAFSGHWLLKGNGSLLTNGEGPASLNRTGNPGMASGGMGDVLSGLIGSILAQGYGVQESAEAAVFIHGAAADIAAEYSGEISLRASEVIAAVPELLLSLDLSNV